MGQSVQSFDCQPIYYGLILLGFTELNLFTSLIMQIQKYVHHSIEHVPL